jgi:hypothetical protein
MGLGLGMKVEGWNAPSGAEEIAPPADEA